ncbi:MAG: PrgI family protein [Candidatus Moranbacteria bacterium]|nr:PrgI family protein [Candidatus Moranbacteria bacterium]
MLINVPQYIDVEDKIAGPLTAKQLGWIIGLGITLLVLWNMVPAPVFFILGLPLAILFVALAFYKPYGQPLGSFLIFGVMYFFRPKVYMWKRTPARAVKEVQKIQQAQAVAVDKHISAQSLKDLAQLLDSEGTTTNPEIEKMLKQAPNRKY